MMGTLRTIFFLFLLQVTVKCQQRRSYERSQSCRTMCEFRCRVNMYQDNCRELCCANGVSTRVPSRSPRTTSSPRSSTPSTPSNSSSNNNGIAVNVNLTSTFFQRLHLPVHAHLMTSDHKQIINKWWYPQNPREYAITPRVLYFRPNNVHPQFGIGSHVVTKYSGNVYPFVVLSPGRCIKIKYTTRLHCFWPGYCKHFVVDCSPCNNNYYLRYDTFLQCHGCFYVDYSGRGTNTTDELIP